MRFSLFKGLALLVTLIVCNGCVSTNNDVLFTVNARVSNTNPGKMIADVPEVITYSTIQAAVDAAPASGDWTIAIAPGTYNELVVIDKPGIRLVGAGAEHTRIALLRYAGQPRSPGSELSLGTFRSAIVQITAPDVSLIDLTVENTFDFLTNDGLSSDDPNRVSGTQAVALRIAEYADRTLLQRVRLLGYQDTLYIDAGRTYVLGGEIRGNVDFIFGKGNALFDEVDIISRPRAMTMVTTGYVTAPSTLLDNEYGLTFFSCRFLRELNVPDNSVPLGRPWHPTTTFEDGRYANPYAVGKTTIIKSFMDAHITTTGWDSMAGTAKDGSRTSFDPIDDARFSESGSYGPGAVINDARPQLSESELVDYEKNTILGDWRPSLLPASRFQALVK